MLLRRFRREEVSIHCCLLLTFLYVTVCHGQVFAFTHHITANNHPIFASSALDSVNGGQAMLAWYEYFLNDYPVLEMLPVQLPGVGDNDLLTEQDVVSKAAVLAEPERSQVYKFLQEVDRRQKQQEQLDVILSLGSPLRWIRHRPIRFRNHIELSDKDLIGDMAAIEAPLDVGNNIKALVDYRLLKTRPDVFGAGNIPSSMEEFIRTEVKNMIKGLTKEQQKKLKGLQIEFTAPDDKHGKLWLVTNHPDCKKQPCIWISPLLIRTMYLFSLTRRVSLSEVSNGSSTPGLQYHLGEAYQLFRQELRFPLAHEMAHIYTQGEPAASEAECDPIGIEVRCDDAAVELLRKLGGGFALGAFSDILNRAMREGSPDLWGIEDGASVESVRCRLNRLNKKWQSILVD